MLNVEKTIKTKFVAVTKILINNNYNMLELLFSRNDGPILPHITFGRKFCLNRFSKFPDGGWENYRRIMEKR